MNRDQYFDRHRNLNIEREMLERKWRAFQEEQQLQEQMMMFEAARAAQSAAAVASGAGGSFEEVLPPYCGGNKQIITYTAFFANILKPGIDRFAPSYSDFDNYVHDEIKDMAARAYRDSYLKAENENKNSVRFTRIGRYLVNRLRLSLFLLRFGFLITWHMVTNDIVVSKSSAAI